MKGNIILSHLNKVGEEIGFPYYMYADGHCSTILFRELPVAAKILRPFDLKAFASEETLPVKKAQALVLAEDDLRDTKIASGAVKETKAAVRPKKEASAEEKDAIKRLNYKMQRGMLSDADVVLLMAYGNEKMLDKFFSRRGVGIDNKDAFIKLMMRTDLPHLEAYLKKIWQTCSARGYFSRMETAFVYYCVAEDIPEVLERYQLMLWPMALHRRTSAYLWFKMENADQSSKMYQWYQAHKDCFEKEA